MSGAARVAVCSRSFSKHPVLRKEILARYERVTFNDEGKKLVGDDLVGFLTGHAKAITALERLDDAVLAKLPELKVIGKFGVGLDMLDLAALSRRGVLLGYTPGVNARSVAELALGSTLSLLRHAPAASADLRAGRWTQPQGRTLSGKTVGLLGLGHVGRELASLLKPFGCRLLAHDLAPDKAFCAEHGISLVEAEMLLRDADVVSVHLPLVAATRGFLDAQRLAMMKHGAILVNTARGGLLDESALKERLRCGALTGAALDVFAEEPPKDAELLALSNLLPTPHLGGITEEAVLAMGRAAIAGLERARPASEFLAP